MTITGGASGARFFEVGRQVIKVGEGDVGDRVGVQGRWLIEHKHIQSLPRVYAAWDRGYVMEYLVRPDWTLIQDWHGFVESVLWTLRHDYWMKDPEVDVDWDAHMRFIRERAEIGFPEVAKTMQQWCEDTCVDVPLTRGLTHGDPTFDNTMFRQNTGALVFIDPNPARPAVPDLVVCDVANVMQSLHGYEHLRYGRPMPQVPVRRIERYAQLEPEEWRAAEYLCCSKFVRLLAYETDLRPVFRQVITRLLEQRG